jgi:hypothetical protein
VQRGQRREDEGGEECEGGGGVHLRFLFLVDG